MRSMLFVPGDRPERFEKAANSGADAIILDLEDAVAPEQRPEARVAIRTFLVEVKRTVPCWVRINSVDTEGLTDLQAILGARPDGIVLPKARDGADVQRVDHWLEALEGVHGLASGQTKLIPMITETAGALLSIPTFKSAPARVCAMTWGAEDLAIELGAAFNRNADGDYLPAYQWASGQCQLVAAAVGVPAIDTVDTEIRELEAVQSRARESRRAGYSGKLAIHPAQIAPIHAAFTPTEQEREWAEAVVHAFAETPRSGAFRLQGKLIDRPHLRQAERILALAQRARGRT